MVTNSHYLNILRILNLPITSITAHSM